MENSKYIINLQNISISLNREVVLENFNIKIKSGKLEQITEWDEDVLFESAIEVGENGLFSIDVDLKENDINYCPKCGQKVEVAE